MRKIFLPEKPFRSRPISSTGLSSYPFNPSGSFIADIWASMTLPLPETIIDRVTDSPAFTLSLSMDESISKVPIRPENSFEPEYGGRSLALIRRLSVQKIFDSRRELPKNGSSKNDPGNLLTLSGSRREMSHSRAADSTMISPVRSGLRI